MIEIQSGLIKEIINPTIFPDKTSQVWKLSDELVQAIVSYKRVDIYWKFQNDSEIFQICQLSQLLKSIGATYTPLHIPYLPYGRQDKTVSNKTTFGQHTFWKIILEFFDDVTTVDIHSTVVIDLLPIHQKKKIIFQNPNSYVLSAIYRSECTIICFPDKGASQRNYETGGKEFFHLEKNRDQLTGNINGLKSPLPLDLKNQKVLIVDDICDGGRTFIEAAKVLYEMGAEEVYLYVTHGIFSKGIQVLKDAGIKRIFTYEGEVL